MKCFDACGAASSKYVSACWIGCFYRTILGAEGMLPTGAGRPGGMSYDALAQAWEAPFASSDPSGGCPAASSRTSGRGRASCLCLVDGGCLASGGCRERDADILLLGTCILVAV